MYVNEQFYITVMQIFMCVPCIWLGEKIMNLLLLLHMQYLGVSANGEKATVSLTVSVSLSAWNTSAPTEWIFRKFDIHVFLKTLKNIQVWLKADFIWKSVYFYDDLAELFLEWEMFQTTVVDNIKAHTIYAVLFSKNHAVLEKKWQIL